MRLPLAAVPLLAATLAFGQSLAELSEQARAQAEPGAEPQARPVEGVATVAARATAVGKRECAKGWEEQRAGGCWTTTSFGNGYTRAWVHPRGWVVDERCMSDPRFTPAELAAGLDQAARWMDPALPLERGGCLGTFNPQWGQALRDEIWTNRIRNTCPPEKYMGSSTYCANAGPLVLERDSAQLISIGKIGGCLGPETSGIGGVLFHETLHATGADSMSLASHNESWRRGQMEFVRDRVYGTEALCAFAGIPERRKWVNIVQCRGAVGYRADSPRQDLCTGFGTSFTDMPMGAVKH